MEKVRTTFDIKTQDLRKHGVSRFSVPVSLNIGKSFAVDQGIRARQSIQLMTRLRTYILLKTPYRAMALLPTLGTNRHRTAISLHQWKYLRSKRSSTDHNLVKQNKKSQDGDGVTRLFCKGLPVDPHSGGNCHPIVSYLNCTFSQPGLLDMLTLISPAGLRDVKGSFDLSI